MAEICVPTPEKSRLAQKKPKSLCERTCQGVTLDFTGLIIAERVGIRFSLWFGAGLSQSYGSRGKNVLMVTKSFLTLIAKS